MSLKELGNSDILADMSCTISQLLVYVDYVSGSLEK